MGLRSHKALSGKAGILPQRIQLGSDDAWRQTAAFRRLWRSIPVWSSRPRYGEWVSIHSGMTLELRYLALLSLLEVRMQTEVFSAIEPLCGYALLETLLSTQLALEVRRGWFYPD